MTTSAFDSTLAGLGIKRTTTNQPKVQTAAQATTLGQADFLKLMTAQLKNQDPFAPVDNTQMVAQMAQFSSLSGISEMSTTLKAISDKLGGVTMSDALGYAGRTVLTAGTTAYPRTSGGIAGAVELGAAASDVTVTVTGPDGATLKQLRLGARDAGTIGYDWDGTTDAGTPAGAGPYTVSVAARGASGPVKATGLVWAPVESVATAGGKIRLTLSGIGDIDADTVRRIG